MKILLVIPTMKPSSGGPCEGIRNFVPELKKLGVICEVLCMDNPNSELSLKILLRFMQLEKGEALGSTTRI